ncbi:MAG TPA: Fic family protein, partial [Vicinamibacteria bacterium]|nr:Fic family protein [Vicinamibacteria bacterium]
REKRLAQLLGQRGLRADDAGLAGIVEDAQLLGSLELAGLRFAWEEVRSSRESGEGPAEVLAWRRARAAVGADAPLSVAALRTWHEALAGPVGFRRGERSRQGPPPAPADRVEERLASLVDWIEVAGTRDLAPDQAAAVALARLVEILPFDDANGRVSRLAASHLMVRAGMRPPILVAGDAARLRDALESAFRLDTEPLVALLGEASGRALDVIVQTLSGR